MSCLHAFEVVEFGLQADVVQCKLIIKLDYKWILTCHMIYIVSANLWIIG